MVEIIIGYGIKIAIIIIATIFSYYIIPWIKQKFSDDQLDTIYKWVETAVKAAEQTITGSERGQEKKAWVIELLNQLGITIDEAIDALIEAAVRELT